MTAKMKKVEEHLLMVRTKEKKSIRSMTTTNLLRSSRWSDLKG